MGLYSIRSMHTLHSLRAPVHEVTRRIRSAGYADPVHAHLTVRPRGLTQPAGSFPPNYCTYPRSTLGANLLTACTIHFPRQQLRLTLPSYLPRACHLGVPQPLRLLVGVDDERTLCRAPAAAAAATATAAVILILMLILILVMWCFLLLRVSWLRQLLRQTCS